MVFISFTIFVDVIHSRYYEHFCRKSSLFFPPVESIGVFQCLKQSLIFNNLSFYFEQFCFRELEKISLTFFSLSSVIFLLDQFLWSWSKKVSICKKFKMTKYGRSARVFFLNHLTKFPLNPIKMQYVDPSQPLSLRNTQNMWHVVLVGTIGWRTQVLIHPYHSRFWDFMNSSELKCAFMSGFY